MAWLICQLQGPNWCALCRASVLMHGPIVPLAQHIPLPSIRKEQTAVPTCFFVPLRIRGSSAFITMKHPSMLVRSTGGKLAGSLCV